MSAKKTGELIKQARTDAGMTQAQLAKKVDGAEASDISKAERGEKELTQTQLKQIARATGVTQASLINSSKGGAGKSGKSSGKSTKKSEELKLSAAEKKLVELYREADTDTKKAAVSLLKGEKNASGLLSALLGGAADLLGVKK